VASLREIDVSLWLRTGEHCGREATAIPNEYLDHVSPTKTRLP
jgi:hypothetical protein